MIYDIFWADKKAQKSFEKLSPSIQSRVTNIIKALSGNPRPKGVKVLQGKLKGVWRIRIGDHRLLYDIDDDEKNIVLLDVGHRKNIYR